MSNPVSDWREALVELLKRTFPDAEVIGGQLDSIVSRDKDRICVFWPKTGIANDLNYANPTMTIRFWVKRPKISAQLKTVPIDDGPLEQAGWDLSVALKPVRTRLITNLYFEVASIAPVRDEYAIEAQLFGWVVNPAAGNPVL